VIRFKVGGEIPVQTPYRQIRADYSEFEADLKPPPEDFEFDRERLLGALKAYLETRALDVDWDTAQAAPEEALINSLAMALPFDPAEKQALLEAGALTQRREALCALLEIDAADTEGDEPQSMQ
jgi:hypothetical protein